jgi:apolipoprotein N-acyltransferase
VWPEAAIPQWLDKTEDYVAHLDEQAKKHDVALIMGVPTRKDGRSFNSMIGIGSAFGQYDKRHLVPFGEYVPLQAMLRGLIGFFDLPMSNFTAGEHRQAGITLLGFNIGSYICYEIAYVDEFLSQFPGAKLIVTISDDTWFGDSFAPAQHLQIAQMRSMETQRYQLVATNDGVTAIIDPDGRVIDRFPQFKTGVLSGTVYAMNGRTPIITLGVAPIIFILFVLLFIAFIYRPEMTAKKRV